MNQDFATAMRRATASTRAMNLAEATAIIRDALAGREMPGTGPADPPRLRIAADPAFAAAKAEAPADLAVPPAQRGAAADPPRPPHALRLKRPLGQVVRALRDGRAALGRPPFPVGRPTPDVMVPVPEGAAFHARSFASAAGTRNYRLYVPTAASEGLEGLVVMLHGCTQTPEDFALGTGMNGLAERHRLLVAYPAQTSGENAMSCWNWFRPSDQVRDAGEPAIIAGLTAALVAEFAVPPGRVFVAGLSADGALVAVMAATYPDLYAAVGVHSGLPHGAANDVVSAFAAMRGEPGIAARAADAGSEAPRIIVFHGDADRTVHPDNAERIAAAARRAASTGEPWTERSAAGSGRGYRRTVAPRADGATGVEVWIVDGAGHAWSGGHPGGSYTDLRGPDASGEMVRFFLESPPGARDIRS